MSIDASLPSQNLTFLEQTAVWIHENPTTVKAITIALLIFGIAMLVACPFLSGVFIVVGLSIGGSLATLTASIALLALDFFIPPHHDMTNHVFKPSKCEGGEIAYEGDVPVLSLDATNPFKAGKAQGYLLGEAINAIAKRLKIACYTLQKRAGPESLPNTLQKIQTMIPEKYLEEIEGLVEGYEQWAQENWGHFPERLSKEDFLMLHMLPDFYTHLDTQSVESNPGVACSSILNHDRNRAPQFARNLDWFSLGVGGTYSIVVRRQYDSYKTIEAMLPGFVGTLTGMNSHGLSIAMNVANGCSSDTKEIRGMPAIFYNRACLEECISVEEVENLIQKLSPLGPYHLTVADSNQGASIHFYQSPTKTHVVRRLEEEPFFTLNGTYAPDPLEFEYDSSLQRRKHLNHFFAQQTEDQQLEEALALPFVNNWETMHRIVMEPRNGIFKVAFDNAFAGKAPLHTLSI